MSKAEVLAFIKETAGVAEELRPDKNKQPGRIEGSYDAIPWPDPLPLQNEKLKPVSPLPVAIIPEPLRDWLADVSYRMQCPLDFVAAGAIVVLSSVVGYGCAIRPKKLDDWTVIPNLWGGIIGRPSQLKSPSLKEIMYPLYRLERAEKERFDEEEAYFAGIAEAVKAQKEAVKQAMVKAARGKQSLDDLKAEYAALQTEQKPIRRRYKTSDSTVEALGVLLNESNRGLLVFRDELTGLLSSWDREDRQTDRAFYLEAWEGSSQYITDRIGRGTIDIKNCCVSILGGIQPGKLLAYLMQATDNLQNDGMIQRFQMLVYPDEPKKWQMIDRQPDTKARARAYAVYEKLANMNFKAVGAEVEDDKLYFRFDADGQQVFYEWLTELQNKISQEENSLMAEHLAKYRSLMPSLALLFHLVNISEGSPEGAVTGEVAGIAAAWTDYLEEHARRIYGMLNGTDEKAANQLAKKIKAGKLKDRFSIRDVYHNNWYLLDKKETVEAACLVLSELNWIRQEYEARENRQGKKIYRINPIIISKT